MRPFKRVATLALAFVLMQGFIPAALAAGDSPALANIWLTDKAASPNTHNYERIWAVSNSVQPLDNYTAGNVDMGAHHIFNKENDNYGVMVGMLQTYIYLNAEAPGTATNGSNSDCYIVISEVGANDPQTVDSRDTSYMRTEYSSDKSNLGDGRILNARFRLDTSQDGTQVFKFSVMSKQTGAAGSYLLTVYRDTGVSTTPKLQTWLKGSIITSDIAGPGGFNYSADYTLYRRSPELKLLTVDEAVAALTKDSANPMTTGNSTYAERFDWLLDQDLLTAVHTGKTARDGAYIIAPTNIGEPGNYMLVFRRGGYLDYVMDNILVYTSWAEAEYDFGSIAMKAGDLDHDGVIGQNDLDIFEQYSTAMSGVYRELVSRVVLGKINHTGFSSINVQVGEQMNPTDLAATIQFLYDGKLITDPQIATKFPDKPSFYLSASNKATEVEHLRTQLNSSYTFQASDIGTLYLYAVLKYTDDMLTPNKADVIYRLGEIKVAAANDASQSGTLLATFNAMALFSSPSANSPTVSFDPSIMDFDGNGYLNDGDLSFIIIYWGLTANRTCYRNNPLALYEAILADYNGPMEPTEPTPETDPGDLTVAKEVISGSKTKPFEFSLNFSGASVDGTYVYTGTGGIDDGIISVTDNQTTFVLKDSQSITIKDLPDGAAYVASEPEYSVAGYKTVRLGEYGKIASNETKIITSMSMQDDTYSPPSSPDVHISGENGTSVVEVTLVPTAFSVTVPTNLPIYMDGSGIITAATNLQVINNGYGPVKVRSVDVQGTNGWSITRFDNDMSKEKVGLKVLGLVLNGDRTVAAGLLHLTPTFWPSVPGGEHLSIVYDANIPAQQNSLSDEEIASVVFTIEWHKI